MVQLRGFLGRILGPSLKTSFLLIKNVLNSLAKSVLLLLGLTTAAPATDTAILKKIFGSGMRPSNLEKEMTLLISNE